MFLGEQELFGDNTLNVFFPTIRVWGCHSQGCHILTFIFGLLRGLILCIASFVSTEYVISMPNMYARGILWGKMVLELGDSCTARNENNGFFSEMQFKTKVRVLFYSNLLQKSEVLTSMFVFFVLFLGGLAVRFGCCCCCCCCCLMLVIVSTLGHVSSNFISVLSSLGVVFRDTFQARTTRSQVKYGGRIKKPAKYPGNGVQSWNTRVARFVLFSHTQYPYPHA